MKPANLKGVADLAAKIRLKVEELGEDHPDLDSHIVKLIYEFFNQDQRDYEILDDNEPNREPFPDLVSAPVERWW